MKKQDIEKLAKEIIEHKNLYYHGKAKISDEEYDLLEDRLRAADPEHPVLSVVGTTVFKNEKIPHQKPMLSLDKKYTVEELGRWIGSEAVVSTLKIDGSSCSLVYENGGLKVAKTRGNGKFGENITIKAAYMGSIPNRSATQESFEVRGEIFITKQNFEKLKKEMVKRGFDEPSSQRNIVAGTLGRKDCPDLAGFLSFQAFEIIGDGIEVESELHKFEVMRELGFQVPEHYLIVSEEDLDIAIGEARKFIEDGEHMADGIVFTYNDLALHEKLGETSHHPRYKMALKFQGETAETEIRGIRWQVSRSGILTPVAIVEAVELSGARIENVTLHNFGVVKENELKPGDVIEITRSGDVIPKFLRVVGSSASQFSYPSECPCCQGELEETDIRLICNSEGCSAQVKETIINYIRKMEIDDLSDKRLDALLEKGLVTDIASLYGLKEEDLLRLEGYKQKLAKKIVQNIQASKRPELHTFLGSIGVSGGGRSVFEKIIQAGFDSLEKILAMKPEELAKTKGFGSKSAGEIAASLKANSEAIRRLLAAGVEPVAPDTQKTTGALDGAKMCITGTLSSKRSEVADLIKQNGGTVQSSVSSATTHLVTNDTESVSSKFKKARSLGLPIISEGELMKMIAGQV